MVRYDGDGLGWELEKQDYQRAQLETRYAWAVGVFKQVSSVMQQYAGSICVTSCVPPTMRCTRVQDSNLLPASRCSLFPVCNS
eukprot:4086345-Amphidinium_carterae.1